jgi:hypothetical protein
MLTKKRTFLGDCQITRLSILGAMGIRARESLALRGIPRSGDIARPGDIPVKRHKEDTK